MSLRHSTLSTSSSEDDVSEYTEVQELSTIHSFKEGQDVEGNQGPITGAFKGVTDSEIVDPVRVEIVDTDILPTNKTKGGQRNGGGNLDVVDTSTVVMRKKKPDYAQSEFKKKARLSRMLRDDESSSDDDTLYTIGSIRHTSRSEEVNYDTLDDEVDDIAVEPASGTGDGNESEATDTEVIPMRILSKVVNPSVLSEVKSHLKKVEVKKRNRLSKGHGQVVEPSPAKLWEMKKKQQNDKLLLNKAQASKLKAGWKVRQYLSSLPEGETVNTLYFTLVKKGLLREVDALFSLAKVSQSAKEFNKDYHDDDDHDTALVIAIENRDAAMMSKLLERGVNTGQSMFHAIDTDFMEGLKLLLLYNPSTNLKINCENPHFQIGMTPMLLAAHNNNYAMLTLLYEFGHRLTDLKDWIEGIRIAWEAANERRMICFARCQPAYITLTTEMNNMNPMKYCLKEIKRLRTYETEEHEFSSYYKDLRMKLEEYMCSLLDYISSSDELAALFRFGGTPTVEKTAQQLMTFMDGAQIQRWKLGSRFELLEKASRENLVRFVTHQQSQLALTYLRFRSIPILKNGFFAAALGMFFPILSLFYICAPNTGLGGIITLPVVSFHCHLMSDIAFATILLIKIAMKDTGADYLGENLTFLEWLIMLWILGKWVQEIQECMNRGFKDYFQDNWNYTDLLLLVLFTASIVIRISDVLRNGGGERIPRYQWDSFEPRLIGESLQAWGYVFVFIRLLGLTRVNRYLGPLQISLAKMLSDVFRFLCLFGFVLAAFAFGLSDLYWYYGTEDGRKLFCKNITTADGNTTLECSDHATAFVSIGTSALDLFWALVGNFDIGTMSLHGKHTYTEGMGKSLIGTYYVVAVIVMLNMLIAMMSNSYNETSENEETAWKFHRTSVWIRYIRREVIRPPPMNLFPNPWRLKENFSRLRDFCRSCTRGERNLTESVYDKNGRRIGQSATFDSRKDLTLRSEVDAAEMGKVKRALTLGPFAGKEKKRDKAGLITRDTSFNVTEKTPEILITGTSSTPSSRRPSLRQQRSTGSGFSPAALSGVRTAIRVNIRENESKSVLRKLVRRYKLKHLIKKSNL